MLYAALGSARHLISGPMAATAALSAAAVADPAGEEPEPTIMIRRGTSTPGCRTIGAAAGVMLLGFAESLGDGKTYAAKNHYDIDADRELLGLGAANLGSGLCAGMVVNGSLSKTAVNGVGGARTQLSGALLRQCRCRPQRAAPRRAGPMRTR